jgi:hypothetical protein
MPVRVVQTGAAFAGALAVLVGSHAVWTRFRDALEGMPALMRGSAVEMGHTLANTPSAVPALLALIALMAATVAYPLLARE